MVLGLNYYYQGGHDTLIQRNDRKETKISTIISIIIFIYFQKNELKVDQDPIYVSKGPLILMTAQIGAGEPLRTVTLTTAQIGTGTPLRTAHLNDRLV